MLGTNQSQQHNYHHHHHHHHEHHREHLWPCHCKLITGACVRLNGHHHHHQHHSIFCWLPKANPPPTITFAVYWPVRVTHKVTPKSQTPPPHWPCQDQQNSPALTHHLPSFPPHETKALSLVCRADIRQTWGMVGLLKYATSEMPCGQWVAVLILAMSLSLHSDHNWPQQTLTLTRPWLHRCKSALYRMGRQCCDGIMSPPRQVSAQTPRKVALKTKLLTIWSGCALTG